MKEWPDAITMFWREENALEASIYADQIKPRWVFSRQVFSCRRASDYQKFRENSLNFSVLRESANFSGIFANEHLITRSIDNSIHV